MCDLKYDVIGKQETAKDDIKYVLMRSGMEESLVQEEEEDGPVLHVSSGGSTEELTKEYFAHLSSAQIHGLIEFYRFDLEAFQYDPYQYGKGK